MSRRVVEFNCYECSHYLYPRMNTELDGNYVIHCPNCGHLHYRTVRGGYITDTRFDEHTAMRHELIMPKSAAVPYSKRRKLGMSSQFRNM